MAIKKEIIDDLLSNYKNPEDLFGEGGIFKELKKALLERALSAELDDHLGYAKSDPKGRKSGNSRNGHGSKKLTGDDGEMEISVPRDRDASFDPKIVKKGQRRFDGFDDKIISMYARGVRRHINWNNLRPDLKEDLAHLVQDIRRRVCGIAIAVSPSF